MNRLNETLQSIGNKLKNKPAPEPEPEPIHKPIQKKKPKKGLNIQLYIRFTGTPKRDLVNAYDASFYMCNGKTDFVKNVARILEVHENTVINARREHENNYCHYELKNGKRKVYSLNSDYKSDIEEKDEKLKNINTKSLKNFIKEKTKQGCSLHTALKLLCCSTDNFDYKKEKFKNKNKKQYYDLNIKYIQKLSGASMRYIKKLMQVLREAGLLAKSSCRMNRVLPAVLI